MSQLDTVIERARRTLRWDGRHEARGRRHPCFGRRSRQALLRRLGLAARCRLRRRRRISGPVHASRLAVLDPLRHRAHVGRAGLGKRTLSRRVRHRGSARRARRSRRRRERRVPPCRSGQAARQRSASGAEQLLQLTPRSAIRTATNGCCRRSPPGSRAGSTRTRRASPPHRIWRARCGARRPPTASTRRARAASEMRTGPTGTPRTWWRSRPARSCRHEQRLRRRRMAAARRHRPEPEGIHR